MEEKFCLRFTLVVDAMMLSRRSGNSYTQLQSYDKIKVCKFCQGS